MFSNVLDAMLLTKPEEHFMDSYAIRNLVLSSPTKVQVRQQERMLAEGQGSDCHYVHCCTVTGVPSLALMRCMYMHGVAVQGRTSLCCPVLLFKHTMPVVWCATAFPTQFM